MRRCVLLPLLLLATLAGLATICRRHGVWTPSFQASQNRRRLLVASPSFELQAPTGGSLANVPSSSSNVDVIAGIRYVGFTISATSGLGTSGEARAQLVSGTAVDCSTGLVGAVAPLDGSTAPTVRTAQLNTFSDVRFATSGVFKLCYRSASASAYELLPVTFTVSGAASTVQAHFCFASTSAACQLQISGAGLGQLYKVALVPYAVNAACGQSALTTTAFSKVVSELDSTASTSSVQVQSLGVSQAVTAATFIVCLCPNFDADSAGGACQAGSPTDFVQTAGRLYVTTVTANVGNIYSGLPIDLTVNCGASVGGCSSGGANRLKIVNRSAVNDQASWKSSLGCGSAEQTLNYKLPTNCESSVMCKRIPDTMSSIAPSWHGILLDSSLLNHRRVSTTLDVCYCDGACISPMQWFKVGELLVKPISAVGPGVVSTVASVTLQGTSGSWATSGDNNQREMKLLVDSYGMVNNDKCFEESQSTEFVSGHACSSSINCASPSASSGNGQTYSGITVKVPGWTAVCYCDRSCATPAYWSIQEQLLVAGPVLGQTWGFYTSLKSDMEVQGWKLSLENRIRLIDKTKQCSDVSASQHTAVAGPLPSSATQLTGVAGAISSIVSYAAKTKVTFASGHGLLAGAYLLLSGVTCTGCSAEYLAMLNTEHRVEQILSSTELVVPTSFPSGSYPTLNAASATWRREDLQVYSGLTVSTAGEYIVCWSASAAASASLSVTAGRLFVKDTPTTTAAVHISTIEPGKVAPIVVSFMTSNSVRYIDAVGKMQLKVVFVNPTLLKPMLADRSQVTEDTAHDTLEEAQQQACGVWILELGTGRDNNGQENPLGFPMPYGCYFKKEGVIWEFYMVFDEKNGLAPAQAYDIVMYGEVGQGLTASSEVVEVWSMDDTVRKRFDAIEVGKGKTSKGAALQIRSGSDPSFDSTDGFHITGTAGQSILELSSPEAAFIATLKAATSKPIRGGSIIRLFLLPLTQWRVGYSCTASCIAHSGSTCGLAVCNTESVTSRYYHRNILAITMPASMADITNVVKHQLNITSLSTPPGGFFPMRWSAELQAEDGKKPHYVITSGHIPYMAPRALVAGIITKSDDGNAKPFKGQQSNELYVKLVLGATLYATSNGDAILGIVLPTGYSVVSGGEAPTTLSILHGMIPSGLGSLYKGTQAATWTAIAPTSQARARAEVVFDAKMVLFAGTSLYFKITVNNPSTPLAQDATGNAWKLKLAAKGQHTAMLAPPFSSFVTGGDANLSTSVSVLGSLSGESITPSSFARGAEGNLLHVFFKTAHAVSALGSVWVDAPSGFDMGGVCQVSDLPSTYYGQFDLSTIDFANPTVNAARLTLPLPYISCTAVKISESGDGMNRAKIILGARLLPGVSYGFTLRIRNARVYRSSQVNDWKIWTYSASGVILDGSLYSVRSNADSLLGSSGSWGMYDYDLGTLGFQVSIPDMRPTDLSTKIQVSPIVFVSSDASNMRVIAPAGYVWNFTAAEFVYRRPSAGLLSANSVTGVEADMPLSVLPQAPSSAPYNVLEFKNLAGMFQPSVEYGFEANINVAQHTPSTSANVFILQIGYDGVRTSGKSQAGSFEALPVRRIVDVVANFRTSVVSMDNILNLSFRTVTDIPEGGGIVVLGPTGFEVDVSGPSCQLSTSAGAEVSQSWCQLGPGSGISAQAVATVEVNASTSGSILQGGYVLRVPLKNPSQATAMSMSTDGSWRLSSYDDLDSQMPEIVDAEGSGPSPRINALMENGRIVSGSYCLLEEVRQCEIEDQQYQKTGRNDRPGEQNNLIFTFNLTRASTAGQFVLRAPAGFRWKAECNVVVSATEVFGAFNTLPANFTAWPATVNVSGCQGHENVAVFQVSHAAGAGLLASTAYVFRIDSIVNALQPQADDFWMLEFNGESSGPVAGFPLWTFIDLQLIPHTTAQSTTNVVTLHISPQNTIPPLGYLQIVAPGGFVIPSQCVVSIATVNSIETWDATLGDFRCQGITELVDGNQQPTNAANLFFEKKSLLAGEKYILRLEVQNPVVPSTAAGSWNQTSYRKLVWITAKDQYEKLDSATFQSFLVNSKVNSFELVGVPPPDGLAEVEWVFTLSLQEAIYATDRVFFLAPDGYVLEDGSSSNCSRYNLLAGLSGATQSSCTGPCYHEVTCEKNNMSWQFHRCPTHVQQSPSTAGLCLPGGTTLQFSLATQNPAVTPASNFFFVRHTPLTGIVLSSSALAAYPIVPLLNSPEAAGVLAGNVQVVSEAVGSETNILISFIPVSKAQTEAQTEAQTVVIAGGVGGQSFSFNTVRPKESGTLQTLTINEREDTKLIVTMPYPMKAGEKVSILLENSRNPSVPGVSQWNLTTYERYDPVLGPRTIVNQKINFLGLEVLGFISVLTSSTLQPQFYATKAANLTLNFQISVAVLSGDEVIVTAPSNFVFKSTPAPSAVELTGGEELINSSSVQEGGRQLLVTLIRELPAASSVMLSAEMDLPSEQQQERNWQLRARSGTGTSKVYATNDLQFPGFSLWREAPFEVVPALNAPGASINLVLAFDQERGVVAQESVRFELTAPTSFTFPSACLSSAELQLSTRLFKDCIGSGNVASLTSREPKIKGRRDTLRVELKVNLPLVTPLINTWTLDFYLDSSSVNTGYGLAAGFDIVPLPASYKGSNQLNKVAPGYFTIRPQRTAEVGSVVSFLHPTDQRYEVSCWALQNVNFPRLPNCEIQPETGDLQLTLPSGGALSPGKNYTIGIGVTNAGRTIPPSMNRWSVIIRDAAGNIQDANYEVAGMQLRSLRISVPDSVVYDPQSAGGFRVVISMTLSHDLDAGLLSELRIQPPPSFNITTQKVAAALPLVSSPEVTETGALLVLLASGVLPSGTYSFQVTGSFLEPAAGTDTTWLFKVGPESDVQFQQVLSGFY